MAELRDQLVLDIDQALRSVDELGDSINRTLSQVRDVQIDDSSFRTVDERLASIESSVSETTSEISELELASGRSAVNFERLARELNVSEDEARRLSQEVLEASNSARRLETEAEGVARALGLSEAQARDFVQQLSRGPKELQQIDDRVDRVNQGFSRMRGLIVGAVAAFGVRGLVNAAGQAVESFNALNESVNAVNVVFEEGADIVFEFGEQSARSAGLARGSFQQLVVPIGSLLRNFGFDANQAAEAAVTLTQRSADLASVFNTEVSEALTAVQAALRGETDPIERFGASVSAARVEALALAEGLAETKSELTDLDKVQARYLLILQDTAKVQGDFLNTADDPANAARIIAEGFEEASASIGEDLIPAYRELLEVAPELIRALEDIGPAIGGIATAAVEAAPGVVAFIDFILEQIDRLTIGLQLNDVRDDLTEVLGGGAKAGNDLIEVLRILAFTDAGDQFDALFTSSRQVEEEFAKIERIVRELDSALDDGVPQLDALSVALGSVGRESIITESLLGILQTRVGLTDLEFEQFLTRFLGSSQAIGLSAGEIAILTFEIERLRDASAFPPGSNPFLFEGQGLTVAPLIEDAERVEVTLRELRAAASEAGVGISEALGSDLFKEGTTFSGLAQVEAQVEGFRDRINAIGPTINPLEGAAEAVDISITEFLENITAQFEQSAEFELALSQLAAQGFDALADSLRGLGPGALGLVEDFLEDTASAEIAEDIFDPAANAFADQLESTFRGTVTGIEWDALVGDAEAGIIAAFTRQNFSRLGEEEVRNIARGIEAPSGLTEAEFSGASVAEEVAGGFSTFFSQNAADISLEAVQDLSTGLVDSSALQEAIDSGRALAEAVNQGFVDNLQFDFNIPAPTPTATPAPVGPNEGLPIANGGIAFEQNVFTTPEREQTDVARSTQLAGAVARNIR